MNDLKSKVVKLGFQETDITIECEGDEVYLEVRFDWRWKGQEKISKGKQWFTGTKETVLKELQDWLKKEKNFDVIRR
jgi:hypothetical protein